MARGNTLKIFIFICSLCLVHLEDLAWNLKSWKRLAYIDFITKKEPTEN